MSSKDMMETFRKKINKKIDMGMEENENINLVDKNEILEKAPIPEETMDYVFFPHKDISTYDLARIIAFSQLLVADEIYKKFPPDLQKHFTKFTELVNK